MAYTSPSTAENQNVSVNVKVNEPIREAPSMANICPKVISSPSFTTNLRARWVMDQKKNRIVKKLVCTLL